MASIGLVLLIAGAVLGVLGVASPTATTSPQRVKLLDTPITVSPNDYMSRSLELSGGQTVRVTLSIDNQTVFTFDIMNQTQYGVWYNCAPRCHQPLLGGSGAYYEQADEWTPVLMNVTVSPSSPYSGMFTAPSNATYYLVLDNSVGPTWASYLDQNASGPTVGQLSLETQVAATTYAIDWLVIGPGAAITLAGGVIATWAQRPRAEPAGGA